MFIKFFYKLKETGIPVSPTSFLTLQKALNGGFIDSLDVFYFSARAILVKSERYFDLYDQVFAFYFEGVPLPDKEGFEIDEMARAMLDEWLKNPKKIADAFDVDESELKKFSPEELIEYFKERLKEQTSRHEGGHKWIGTGGTSPVGHSGFHPGGMRVGGGSRNKSAVKVAEERRYKDYSAYGPLTQAMMGEALKRLRHMIPAGPKDQINIDETIYRTMKNGGEIELVFDRSVRDRLKVILVTIHIPLSKVSETITIENIVKTIGITSDSLKSRFGINDPVIAVAGLNPHAGENSMFGHEEKDIIEPAVKIAMNQGFNVQGPFPPDTLFYHAVQGRYHGVVCMYHDQGLIPFKMIHFNDGVNTTIGLPIIRTSVDHGTAYDIAWQGIADSSSLKASIKMAVLQANSTVL
jgi:hypothetical protein